MLGRRRKLFWVLDGSQDVGHLVDLRLNGLELRMNLFGHDAQVRDAALTRAPCLVVDPLQFDLLCGWVLGEGVHGVEHGLRVFQQVGLPFLPLEVGGRLVVNDHGHVARDLRGNLDVLEAEVDVTARPLERVLFLALHPRRQRSREVLRS